MTTVKINHFLIVNINAAHKFKSVLLSFPFILEYLLLLLILLPPPPLPALPLPSASSTVRLISSPTTATTIPYSADAIGSGSSDGVRDINGKPTRIFPQNYKELCEIDFEIIEAIQQTNIQMDTNNVAIFIDDEFDLSENWNSILRALSHEKASLLNKIVSAKQNTGKAVDDDDGNNVAICCGNGKSRLA